VQLAPLPFDVVAAAIANGKRLEREANRAIEPEGLTWDAFMTLFEIETHRGGAHGGAIARRLALHPQTVHRYVGRFEARGLVRPQAVTWVTKLHATAAGRRTLWAANDDLADIYAAIRRIPLIEQQAIVTGHRSVVRELRRPPGYRSWLERYLQPELWDDGP
jgi:DNA-binding MarR family transcriptional regulator